MNQLGVPANPNVRYLQSYNPAAPGGPHPATPLLCGPCSTHPTLSLGSPAASALPPYPTLQPPP